MLMETGMAFMRSQPANFIRPLKWLLQGKTSLKQGLAQNSEIDVSLLPYDPAVIELIEVERQTGRTIILATATHHSLADQIAGHLKLFDRVLATDANRNLSAERKRDLLVELYGEGGFDYVGNSLDDLSVWAASRKAYVVNPEAGVELARQGLRKRRAGYCFKLFQLQRLAQGFAPSSMDEKRTYLRTVAGGTPIHQPDTRMARYFSISIFWALRFQRLSAE